MELSVISLDIRVPVSKRVSVKLVCKKGFVYICVLIRGTNIQFIDIDGQGVHECVQRLSECPWSRVIMSTGKGAHVYQLGGELSHHDERMGDMRYYEHVPREGTCFRVSRKYRDEHMQLYHLPSTKCCPSAIKDLLMIIDVKGALRTIDVERNPIFALYLAAMITRVHEQSMLCVPPRGAWLH